MINTAHHFSEWEDWELEQRRHVLKSLIDAYEGYEGDMSKRRLAKLRRYQREHQFVIAEMQCRANSPTAPVQIALFVLD